MKKVTFFLASILSGAASLFYLTGVIRLAVQDSPFLKFTLSLLAITIVLASGSIYFARQAGLSTRMKLALGLGILILFTVAGTASSYLNTTPAFDVASMAFEKAGMNCQAGVCQYRPTDVEKRYLFGAKTIYSLTWNEASPCRILSFAANEESGMDSAIVDYGGYVTASYISTTRLMHNLFQRLYPRITLISRSEYACEKAGARVPVS